MALTTAQAFIVQAREDFAAYDMLILAPSISQCSWLHFLQMATEKLAKAYLALGGASFEAVSKSHASFGKQARPLFRQYLIRRASKSLSDRAPQLTSISMIARQIELLHPSIDHENRPENCEYPWLDGTGQITTPVNL